MRTLLILIFVILIGTNTFSQRTPEMFLSALPDPASAACELSNDGRASFSNKIGEVQNQLLEEIGKRKEEYTDFAKDNNKTLQEKIASDMGLSPADMAKLQNGGQMSQEQAMALANKMMGQQYNMSVGEAKNLGKMGKEGQKAWAEGYSAEMTAEAQANPDKFKNGQAKNKKLFDLAAEQNQLTTQIQAEESMIEKRLEEINKKDSVEKKRLNEQLAPLQVEADKYLGVLGVTGANAAKSYAIALKMYNLRLAYCELMTPLYIDLLKRRLVSVKANFILRYRLQEITDELTAAQTGAKDEKVEPDMMALDSVSRYLTSLEQVFKYSPGDKPTNN